MRLTIARRLWAIVALSAISLIIVGTFGVMTAYQVKADLDTITGKMMRSNHTLTQLSRAVINLRLAVLTHGFVDAADSKAEQARRIDELKTELNGLVDGYARDLVIDEQDRKMLAEDRSRLQRYTAEADHFVALSDAHDDAIKTRFEDLRKAALFVNEAISAHVTYNDELVARQSAEAAASVAHGLRVDIGGVVIGVAAVLGLGIWLVRAIARGLAHMQRTVTAIEHSLDMTRRVPIERDDELGATALAFNHLVERMQASLRTMAGVAGEVSAASIATAASSSQLAQAASQQSGAAANMASSIEELTVSIHHVGDRAAQTNDRVTVAGTLATEGEAVVHETVADIQHIAQTVQDSADVIGRLEAQSAEIVHVIQVIQEVADQTNLLALNAAIEAARAGEAGRGFAVVADEVRKLAERTALSTRQITDTIDTMRAGAESASASMREAVRRVDVSAQRALKASEAIHQIGDGARESVHMVAEIADAIREQSSASTAVAQSVEQIAQMSEESAAAAAEGANAAHDLDTLARRMQSEVARYTL
ncbi:MAG: methyl-accepting chemotaxis protein [Rhodocyclaceae bacterium]